MTRRDYELLAAAFKVAYNDVVTDSVKVGVTKAVVAVADALAYENPRFDRLKFYQWAGVPPRSFAYRRAARAAVANSRSTP